MVKIYTKILFLLMISSTSLLATNTEMVKVLDKENAEKSLKLSCINNDIDSAKELIEKYNEYYYSPDIYGKIILKMILNNNINIDLVKLLINNKANVNFQPDEEHDTPLHIACSLINVGLVKILIDKNADVNFEVLECYQEDCLQDEEYSSSFPLDRVLEIADSLPINKTSDALEIVKCLLLEGGNYSEEYNEKELLIKAREDILQNVKACNSN